MRRGPRRTWAGASASAGDRPWVRDTGPPLASAPGAGAGPSAPQRSYRSSRMGAQPRTRDLTMMGNQGNQQPIIILKEGTRREKGRGAQSNNIMAARAVADAVRSTLGPKGMDKMLVSSMGDVVITNDGVTILKEIDIEHPAAKMIVEVAKTQDQSVGDGTTSAVIIAGDLPRRAEELIDDVHPTLINQGYRLAHQKALEILNSIAQPVSTTDKDL